MITEESQETFHLGLTMAGAVSAGCYTAGVMDYIFEVLDLWEKAKKGEIDGINKNLVPKNKVVIDAMGGASAGGMATIMTAVYCLNGNIKPVKEIPKKPMESQNLIYDSWIHLDDDKEKLTFEKMWDVDNFNESLLSIFNSKVIDNIANRAFCDINDKLEFEEHVKNKLPNYISKDLEILLSHTLLRGIPLAVDFKTKIAKKVKKSPKHITFEHYLVSHFKLNYGKKIDETKYMWLNPYHKDYAKKMILSTISTGAFPVGLAYREFDQNQFNDDYIKSVIKRVIYGDFSKENPDIENKIDLKIFPKNFESIGVDGGTINNEPYNEVLSILKGKFYDKNRDYQNFGIIMIDPFPDNDDKNEDYKKPKNLLDVIGGILGTLMDQSRIKRKEMIEHYSTDYFKGVIYPRKHLTDANGKYLRTDENPIGSASFHAFGGFLDIEFRLHDFFLGRNNARNFLRYYCSLPYDKNNNIMHPMHSNWTDEMIERFKTVNKKGQFFLPIIPDLNLILDNIENIGDERYNYTYKEKPKYNSENLFKLEKNIVKRFKYIIEKLLDKESVIDKVEKFPITKKLLDARIKKSILINVKNKIMNFIFKIIKKKATKVASEEGAKIVTKIILEDLEHKGFL